MKNVLITFFLMFLIDGSLQAQVDDFLLFEDFYGNNIIVLKSINKIQEVCKRNLDSSISENGNTSYSYLSFNKYPDSKQTQHNITITSFDSSGNFMLCLESVYFNTWDEASAWIERFNNSKLFETNYKYYDIDLSFKKSGYFVKYILGDRFLEIKRGYGNEPQLTLIYYPSIPWEWENQLEAQKKQGKKKKKSTKK